MGMIDGMLAEFDHETDVTRRVLERVPEADVAWKPHPKSSSLGDLALHVSNLPRWVVLMFEAPSFDVTTPFPPRKFESTAALVETFLENVKNARAAMANASEDDMRAPWKLLNAGKTVFEMPRVAALRGFVFNHSIHHRGQLSVYLRLRDVPLPEMYGPTADTKAGAR